MILDLDPDEALPFSQVAMAGRRVRALLSACGLESFVKTTGGKGLHVCVPLAPGAWLGRAGGVHASGGSAAPARRTFRLYREHGQGAAETARSTSTTCAMPGAPTRSGRTPHGPEAGRRVSVPVEWGELDRLSPDRPTTTVAEVPLRVLGFGSGQAADPWAGYLERKQRVPASLTRDLAG